MRPLKSAALMFVGQEAAWQPVTWTLGERKGPWECPKRLRVTVSCASSKAQSATSGTGSLFANAKTDVKKSQVSHVHQMASPITTSATWMQRHAPKALHLMW